MRRNGAPENVCRGWQKAMSHVAQNIVDILQEFLNDLHSIPSLSKGKIIQYFQ